jgi:hypothetical protein
MAHYNMINVTRGTLQIASALKQTAKHDKTTKDHHRNYSSLSQAKIMFITTIYQYYYYYNNHYQNNHYYYNGLKSLGLPQAIRQCTLYNHLI